MSDLIRDSVFGQLTRLITGGKVFKYPDEVDPSIREKYINKDKSGILAQYGALQPPREDDEDGHASSPDLTSSDTLDDKKDPEKDGEAPAQRVTSNTSTTARGLHSSHSRPNPLGRTTSHTNSFLTEVEKINSLVSRINTASGKPVDPEKGRDIHLVDWYGPDDPEVPFPPLEYSLC
jgi:MFS transporter, DHA1 family, multidrug resistance protein